MTKNLSKISEEEIKKITQQIVKNYKPETDKLAINYDQKQN